MVRITSAQTHFHSARGVNQRFLDFGQFRLTKTKGSTHMAQLAICLPQPGLCLQGASPPCTAHWPQLLPSPASRGLQDTPGQTGPPSHLYPPNLPQLIARELRLSPMTPRHTPGWHTASSSRVATGPQFSPGLSPGRSLSGHFAPPQTQLHLS